MKASDLRELSVEELAQRAMDLSEELFNLKFQLVTGQLENRVRVRQLKRDVARIKTLIREKHKK